MSGHISLVTQQHSPKLANPVNASCASVLITRYASATPSGTGTVKPISVTATSTNTSTPGGTLVVPGGMNYLKIMPFWITGTSAASPTIRVVGWSYSKDTSLWIPSLICNIACVVNSVGGIAVGGAVSGSPLLPCTSLTNSIGDAKIFNGTSLASNSFFVVDTLGFEQIELCFQATSAFACNAFVSEI